jgi:hypothetical protein
MERFKLKHMGEHGEFHLKNTDGHTNVGLKHTDGHKYKTKTYRWTHKLWNKTHVEHSNIELKHMGRYTEKMKRTGVHKHWTETD